MKDKFHYKVHKLKTKKDKIVKVIKKVKKKSEIISFCITCKDREHHLKKTLPINIKATNNFNVEFCVLNYNSSGDLDDWIKEKYSAEIKSKLIKYYKTDKPKYFHMSHAKNMVHKMASGEILCSLDADTFIHPELCNIIIRFFRSNNCFLRRDGLMIIRNKDFIGLGGYDENFVGWGWEDVDFSLRSAKFGINPIELDVLYYQTIKHHDNDRNRNTTISIHDSYHYNLEILNKNNKNGVIRVNLGGFGEEKDIPKLDALMEKFWQ